MRASPREQHRRGSHAHVDVTEAPPDASTGAHANIVEAPLHALVGAHPNATEAPPAATIVASDHVLGTVGDDVGHYIMCLSLDVHIYFANTGFGGSTKGVGLSMYVSIDVPSTSVMPCTSFGGNHGGWICIFLFRYHSLYFIYIGMVI